ncbi:putative phage abortive infection protein [Shimia marina]|uniref:Phage abortive infection protein n=1 Tax=Shimia marina TaxID=321267 RepID=A0A0P1ETX9_9RHOB|nr:putative phage abortive infection protein [Shimia marina]CUH54074.1 hypothetical protein SHM7688_03544 [Shimia marina]SFE59828.1 Putative phage abortive infection protein [Shimia marina]
MWFLVAVFFVATLGFLVVWWLVAKMKQPRSLRDWVLIGLPTASVLLLWMLGWTVIPHFFGRPNSAGAAGDMFGSITSLFSGLAFVGLIVTLVLQRSELSLQRKELSETREEFQRQRFEARYFSTLNLLNQHIRNMRLPSDEESRDLRGSAVLEYFASELPNEQDPDLTLGAHGEMQIAQYLQLYDILFEPNLGPYFRLMYNCVRQIENSGASEEEKEAYSKILRAQLSSPEVKLLMFNCSTSWGEEFKPWVEKYRLLKHLPREFKEHNPWLSSGFRHLEE